MWPAYNSNEQQQFDFLDMITIYSAVLQTLDYAETMNQSSNDDILKELRKDMAKIMEQNNEIIRLLKGFNPEIAE